MITQEQRDRAIELTYKLPQPTEEEIFNNKSILHTSGVQNPIRRKPYQDFITAEEYKLAGQNKENLSIVSIPVSEIVSQQVYVDPEKIREYIDKIYNQEVGTERFWGIKKGHMTNLLNGNHRVSAYILCGYKYIDIPVYEINLE